MRDETKSQHLDQCGSTLSRELQGSVFKVGFSSAEKAKDQIENLNLYLDSELLQSLLAFIFTSRYHQAGLSMLVLMNYSKPLCDMYYGIMNLCSVLTCFGGGEGGSLFKRWEVKARNAPQLSNFISEMIWNS